MSTFSKVLLTVILLFSAITTSLSQSRYLESYYFEKGWEAVLEGNLTEAYDYLAKELKENSNNGYAMALLASIYEYSDDYSNCISYSNKALKAIPKQDDVWVAFAYTTRANAYYKIDDLNNAIKDYSMSINYNPNNYDVYKERAQCYFEQEKYDLSDKDYNKMISLDAGNIMGYMGLGRNAKMQGLYNTAIEKFDYVIKMVGDSYSSAYSFRAECYLYQKKYNEAINDIIKALSIDGDDKAWSMMFDIEDVSAFNTLVSKLKIQSNKEPNNYYWSYCLGVLHESKDKYSKAIAYYEEAYKKDADALTAKRIATCYDELGDYASAINYLDEAIEMDSTRYDLFQQRAETYNNMGNKQKAIADMSKFVQAYPEYYGGYYQRGWFKDHAGDWDGALEDYEMTIALNPDYHYVYLNRGTLNLLQGNTEEAYADFRKIVEIETDPSKYTCVFYAYHYLGNDAKAKECMDVAISNRQDKGVYYEAACLYSLMNEKEKALEYLQKSLEMGYCARMYHIKHDRDLNNIRNTEKYKLLIAEYEKKNVGSNEEERTFVEKVVEVPFTQEGGVYKVKCVINGLPLHFIFDTGASTVSMSGVEALFMLKNDYLKAQDFVGTENYINADGEISEGAVINLRNVEFGGLKLTNVKASIVKNQKAPLLLGQSVLKRLGKIEIDYAKKVLKITYKEKAS